MEQSNCFRLLIVTCLSLVSLCGCPGSSQSTGNLDFAEYGSHDGIGIRPVHDIIVSCTRDEMVAILKKLAVVNGIPSGYDTRYTPEEIQEIKRIAKENYAFFFGQVDESNPMREWLHLVGVVSNGNAVRVHVMKSKRSSFRLPKQSPYYFDWIKAIADESMRCGYAVL